MTNSEWFEKNDISFYEVMKLFKESKIKSLVTFLKSEYNDFNFKNDNIDNHKFKIGDIVVLQLNDYTRYRNWDKNVVFEIVKYYHDKYYHFYVVRFLTPTKFDAIGNYKALLVEFIDDNCVLY